MSEQPANIFNSNEYHLPSSDGAVEMDQQTDVWLKASQLPLGSPAIESTPIRELSEHEKQIIEIHMAAEKLRLLNDERIRRQAA